MCYRRKADALNVFKDYNLHVTENWGGLLQPDSTGATFDAINERYGLRGKKKVKSFAEAYWVAMPPHPPYCLDRIDIKTLNELPPAQEHGGLRLPNYVYDEIARRAEEKYYQQALYGRVKRELLRGLHDTAGSRVFDVALVALGLGGLALAVWAAQRRDTLDPTTNALRKD
jgi:hypothetical protein